MAKINEQKINITLSKLLRDSEEQKSILSDEELAAVIEAIIQLAGNEVLVELED